MVFEEVMFFSVESIGSLSQGTLILHSGGVGEGSCVMEADLHTKVVSLADCHS